MFRNNPRLEQQCLEHNYNIQNTFHPQIRFQRNEAGLSDRTCSKVSHPKEFDDKLGDDEPSCVFENTAWDTVHS